LDDFPNVKRWYDAMNARPAVRRGLQVGEELRRPPEEWDDESRAILFGNRRRERA
jgi:GST-like protein